jgi:hypothetical protein
MHRLERFQKAVANFGLDLVSNSNALDCGCGKSP